MTNKKIIAYIDAANLHKGIKELGWNLDYIRFRIWLRDKYCVSKAYIFIGFIPGNEGLYKFLNKIGYILIFKETVLDHEGKPKGNCDADLVLKMISDFYKNNFDQAILVTGDGDYASSVKFLLEKRKLKVVLAPNNKKCSILLKRTNAKITYLMELKKILAKRKSPR